MCPDTGQNRLTEWHARSAAAVQPPAKSCAWTGVQDLTLQQACAGWQPAAFATPAALVDRRTGDVKACLKVLLMHSSVCEARQAAAQSVC